jgi:hypothetical protein
MRCSKLLSILHFVAGTLQQHHVLRNFRPVRKVFRKLTFFFQDALSDKQWGQKINVPRESIDKTVAIAKGEDEISNEGFYDANQWEYYHWTVLHPNNKRKAE